MNDIYKCDKCAKDMQNVFNLNDEAVCEECFGDAITRTEYAYEAMREAIVN